MKRQNLRTVSLVVITFTYLLGGAAIFGWLESDAEVRQRDHLELIEGLIRKKYNISEDDYKVLWTTIIRSAPHKAGTQWKFPGAFYFATTVVTTIGYGHSTPSTLMGRSFCMLYALIGIPLGLVMFQCIGERLNALVSVALRKLKSCTNAKNQDVTATNKVAVVSVLSLILMTSMAWVFAKYERWDYFDALYYCFITLTTIGFGDYVALQKDAALQSKPEYVIMSLVFILFGLSVVSSAVNLLVLKFLTLNTEDERRDELARSTAAQNPILLEGDVITSPGGKLEYVDSSRPAPDLSAPHQAQRQLPLASDELVVWHFRGQTKTRRRRTFGSEQQQQVASQPLACSLGGRSSETSVSSPTVKEMVGAGFEGADETASQTSESLQRRRRASQVRAGRGAAKLPNTSNGHELDDSQSDSLAGGEDEVEARFGHYLHHHESRRPDETCGCQCEFNQSDEAPHQEQWQAAAQLARGARLPANQTVQQLKSPAADLALATAAAVASNNSPSADSLASFASSRTKANNSARVSPLPFASSESGSLRRVEQGGTRTGPEQTRSFRPFDGANCVDGFARDQQQQKHCRVRSCQVRSKIIGQNYHHEADQVAAASQWRHFHHCSSTDSGQRTQPPLDKQQQRRQRQHLGEGVIVSSAAAGAQVANQSSCSCSWVSLASESPARNGRQSSESLKRPTGAAKCNNSSSFSCLQLDAECLVRSHSQDPSAGPTTPAASSHPHNQSSGVSLERQALARLAGGGGTTRPLAAATSSVLAPPPTPFRSSQAVHGSEQQNDFLREVTSASSRHQSDLAQTTSSPRPAPAGGSRRPRARRRSFTDDDLDYERRLENRQLFHLAQWQTPNSSNKSDRRDLELRPKGISQAHEMQRREDSSSFLTGVFHANHTNKQQQQLRPLTAPDQSERRQPTGASSARRKSSSSSGQKQHKANSQRLVCRCCCQHAECIEYALETTSKRAGPAEANSPQGAASESANSEQPPTNTDESSAQATGGGGSSSSETYSETSRTFQQSATTPRENCDNSRTTNTNTPSPPVGKPDLGSNFSAHSEPADESFELGPIVSCDDGDGQQLSSTSK